MYRVGEEYRAFLLISDNLCYSVQPLFDEYANCCEPSSVGVNGVRMRVADSGGGRGDRCDTLQDISPRAW